MANKNLFNQPKVSGPVADTVNDAGGLAYKHSDKHALAQYVLTGCLNSTYYASADVQLDRVLELCKNVPTTFIAQTAVYARENGFMKDTPALLCAVLAVRDVPRLKVIFNRVIDNGKMLRNFVQIVRSGAVGRKSFGTAIKKLVQRWFDSRRDDQLFRDSIGNDPSLADVIKMVHPTPKNTTREALYGYIIGKRVVNSKREMEVVEGRKNTVLFSDLPELVQAFETYKSAVLGGKDAGEVPNVPFQLLTALNLGEKEWTKIAENAPWTMTRMNLNAFESHGVFKSKTLVKLVAERLANADEVKKARAFPYQILNAYKNVGAEIPTSIKNALQDALEVATENVPSFESEGVHVLVDTSGSMGSPVTGNRGTVSTSVRCVDVAGLMAACVLRKNDDAEVLLFDTETHTVNINPRDSVMTNAQKFARGGGGTDCACAVKALNDRKAKGDLVIMISDNESWVAYEHGNRFYAGTGMQAEWKNYKKRNPKAKLVLIDIQPGGNTQVKEANDVLNVGGFSDSVFDIVAAFAAGKLGSEHWIGEIENISVEVPANEAPIVAAKTGAAKAVKRKKK
jgi:60 kDa SS-A/Ro ribonucleoprotein